MLGSVWCADNGDVILQIFQYMSYKSFVILISTFNIDRKEKE